MIPAGKNSDHAGNPIATGGPSWVAAIVNAIGNSSYWANTAIIVTWDDWGGWYDHVPPPQVINDGTSWGSGYVYGFRVPLIVISSYAKPGYISHVDHDSGSIYGFWRRTLVSRRSAMPMRILPTIFSTASIFPRLRSCFAQSTLR